MRRARQGRIQHHRHPHFWISLTDYDINAEKDITIAGSEINAGENGSITAGGNVYIISKEETSSTTSKVTRGTADLSAGCKARLQ
jgi:hypothetical protein